MPHSILLNRDEDNDFQREYHLIKQRKGTKRDNTNHARLMYLGLQGTMVRCYCYEWGTTHFKGSCFDQFLLDDVINLLRATLSVRRMIRERFKFVHIDQSEGLTTYSNISTYDLMLFGEVFKN